MRQEHGPLDFFWAFRRPLDITEFGVTQLLAIYVLSMDQSPMAPSSQDAAKGGASAAVGVIIVLALLGSAAYAMTHADAPKSPEVSETKPVTDDVVAQPTPAPTPEPAPAPTATSTVTPTSTEPGTSVTAPTATSSPAIPAPVVTPSRAPSPAVAPVVAPRPVSTSKYKDGTYTADGTYESPGGTETVTVSLTIAKDIVTDTTFAGTSEEGISRRMMGVFASNYKPLVIGQNLSTLHLDKVSRSSLTPEGFNDAVAKIQAQAKA